MSLIVQRRVQFVLLALGVIVTLVGAVIVAGAYRSDSKIDAHKASAVAEVIDADRLHAAVNFVTPDGVLRNPKLGLLYPTQLSTGQRIVVDYDATDPDNVARPSGRDASLSVIPAVSIVGIGWAAVIVLMLIVAEAGRRTRPVQESPIPSDA